MTVSGSAIGEMQFTGGSDCALQADGTSGDGQVLTRLPAGALFFLDQGVTDCTVTKAPQNLLVCDDVPVGTSVPSQFSATCTPDTLVGSPS